MGPCTSSLLAAGIPAPGIVEDPPPGAPLEEDLPMALRRRAPLADVQAIVHRDRRDGRDEDQQRHYHLCVALAVRLRSNADVVAFLASTWPEALLVPDEELGTLPLHAAIKLQMGEVVRALVALGGEAVLQVRDRHRQLPLHVAAGGANPDLVKTVAEAWPDALPARGNRGRLPLHVVAASSRGDGEALRAAQILAGAYPRALRVQDEDGRRPLHCAVASYTYYTSTELVEFLAARSPRALMKPDRQGQLPLHIAAASQWSAFGLIHFLLDAGPAHLLHVRDRQGRTPLLLAVGAAIDHGGREGVELLVDRSPQVLLVPDDQGRLPLHVAAERLSTPGARGWVRFLADRAPAAGLVQDHRGRTPLHGAAACPGLDASHVAEQLAASVPEALLMQDDLGQTPVHAALAHRDVFLWALIRPFLNFGPEALRVQDKRGKLPLHHAAALRGTHAFDLVQLVATKWMGALQGRDEGGRLPVHVAMEAGESLDIVYFLLRMYPPALEPCGGGQGVEQNTDWRRTREGHVEESPNEKPLHLFDGNHACRTPMA